MISICQGHILMIERIAMPVLVVSKDFFNQGGQIIGCPVVKNAALDPLHIPISYDGEEGIVMCEQMKFLDTRTRAFKKIGELPLSDVINITDAVQGIFDYI